MAATLSDKEKQEVLETGRDKKGHYTSESVSKQNSILNQNKEHQSLAGQTSQLKDRLNKELKKTTEEEIEIGQASTMQQIAARAENERDKMLKRQKSYKNIKNDIISALRIELQKENSKGVSYYQRYMQTFLQDALADPSGRPSMILAPLLFNNDNINKLDTINKQLQRDRDYQEYRIRKTLFDKQQEVYDNDIDKKIIVICSRRSGKTELIARKIIKACLVENTPVLYLNKTFDNAIRQLFDLIIGLLDKVELEIERSSKNGGFIEFKNGSSVSFGGVNDIAQIDKYRGYKYRLVVVDEIGHIKNSKYLIDEVLGPATMDYADSQMIFTGTPPRNKNYATELWHSNIKKYHWTFLDNPYIPNGEAYIDLLCKEKGITKDDPYIQREYYGNMEAYDSDAIVWPNYLTYHELPKDHYPSKVYIGVDFGYIDDNAIVTISVDEARKRAYVIAEDVFNKAPDEVIKARIEKAYTEALDHLVKYGYSDSKNRVKIITDTNEPSLAYSLYQKGLPVEKAYKYDMLGSVEELGALLRTHIYTREDQLSLIKDYQNTLYKRDDETDNIIPEIDDAAYHPNAAHALRYAARNFADGWTHVSAGYMQEETMEKRLRDEAMIISSTREETLPEWMQEQHRVAYEGSGTIAETFTL